MKGLQLCSMQLRAAYLFVDQSLNAGPLYYQLAAEAVAQVISAHFLTSNTSQIGQNQEQTLVPQDFSNRRMLEQGSLMLVAHAYTHIHKKTRKNLVLLLEFWHTFRCSSGYHQSGFASAYTQSQSPAQLMLSCWAIFVVS